jgi:mRNA-degrading endonuclease toxin of MazEF toxin-antitoxin module
MKRFDEWNIRKKLLSEESSLLFPKIGEVWIVSLGVNIGCEQDGSGVDFVRPVLVYKRISSRLYIVLPLSTKQKNLDFYHNIQDVNGQKIAVIIAQIRVIGIERFARKLYVFEWGMFADVQEKLKSYLF